MIKFKNNYSIFLTNIFNLQKMDLKTNEHQENKMRKNI